ncbi:MAG: MmcQ/YjbR family DNA-binding protein [Flavobacteriia bacterium]|nr:MmcQ/YjbR family DNA-binding protein [Flavobacteriia bacterium]
MHLDEILQFCLQLKGTTEHFPFDQKTLVFKVMGKMYALIDVEKPDSMNLKCDPERAIELRERYACVLPGWHMSKKHWNTVLLNNELNTSELQELIVHSYELVVSSLPKKLQHELSIG